MRRHKEQLEHISGKAFGMSILQHSTEDHNEAPRLAPYETQKLCSVCNVMVSGYLHTILSYQYVTYILYCHANMLPTYYTVIPICYLHTILSYQYVTYILYCPTNILPTHYTAIPICYLHTILPY